MKKIYITPVGFQCDCGASQTQAETHGHARRMAEQHARYGHIDMREEVQVIELQLARV